MLLALLTLLSVAFCSGRGDPKFGTDLTEFQLAGAFIMILAGLFMTFFGKRFFKTLLATLGFIISAVGGSVLAGNQCDDSSVAILLYGLCGGIYGALLFASLWRTGVIILSTAAGASVAAFLLNFTDVVSSDSEYEIAVTIGAFIASILGYVYSKLAITFIMAILGSGATTLGARKISGPNFIVESMLFPVLVISGIAVQIVVFRNKKTQVDDLDAPTVCDRPAFNYLLASTSPKI
jgi:hypothetical protein